MTADDPKRSAALPDWLSSEPPQQEPAKEPASRSLPAPEVAPSDQGAPALPSWLQQGPVPSPPASAPRKVMPTPSPASAAEADAVLLAPSSPSPAGIRQQLLALPKPILFGLCGAAGGLLGAVILGEMLWLALRPAAATAPPLQIAASPSVTAFFGGKNHFSVTIARNGFDGPVRVEALERPVNVRVPTVTIPAGQTTAELGIAVEAADEE